MEGVTDMKSMPPSSYTSFPRPKTTTPLTLRDASFSSPKKDAPHPAMEGDSEIDIFDAQKYFNESYENQHKESTRVAPAPAAAVQHTESMSATRASSVSSVVEGYGRNHLAQPFHPSPTGWSEASWSSNTELLCNSPWRRRINRVNMTRTIASEKTNFTKWFYGIICRILCLCPCWGQKKIPKNEVEKMEKVSEPRSQNHHDKCGSDPNRLTVNLIHNKVSKKVDTSPSGHGRDWTVLSDRPDLIRSPPHRFPPEIAFPSGAGISFPVVVGQSSPVKFLFTSERNPIPLKELRRRSLDIFRPSDICISRKSSDCIPPPRISAADDRWSFKFSANPPKSGGAAIDDEEASDASSDLFEIETLTTPSTTNTATSYPKYHHRQDCLDEALRMFGFGQSAVPSVAPTEGYEPSEASIEWSVTTAEGFDRGSVTNFSASASDIVDDVTLMRQELQRLGNGGFVGDNDDGRRRRENGILVTSCRCGGLRRPTEY